MISVEKAIHLVLKNVSPLHPVWVPMEKALGRVLAKGVKAPFDFPRFANSAMDGYALHSADARLASPRKPVDLALQSRTVFAGTRGVDKLAPKSAVRIMTGAPLPKGADAVLPQEEAKIKNGRLILQCPVRYGYNIRPVGEDGRKGERVLSSGTFITPPVIGFLSALGIRRISICRPPRVAIIVTGNEVRPPAEKGLLPGKVCDTHTAFLRAALREFDLQPVWSARVRDRTDSLKSRLKKALGTADLVLVTGGVSVGERDFVRPVAKSLGVKTIFWGVAQKPGKPLFFGRKNNCFLFGLPGNPAAAVVCYLEYVRPALLKMLGFSKCRAIETTARLVEHAQTHSNRTFLLRGRLCGQNGDRRVVISKKQGSHLLRSFVDSNCLAILPNDFRYEDRKQNIKVHLYPWRTI